MELDDFQMNNPNLYITLPESEHNGFLLAEDGVPLLLEDKSNLFT